MEKTNIHANRRIIVNYSIIQNGFNGSLLNLINEPNLILAGDTKTTIVKMLPATINKVVFI